MFTGGKNCILIIKYSALGDIILCTSFFKAIKEYHTESSVTIMTSVQFASIMKKMPYFTSYYTDYKPKPWQILKLIKIAKFLLSFDTIYDLQTNDRTAFYFYFTAFYAVITMSKMPNWFGECPGSIRHNPKGLVHAFELLKYRLLKAGVSQLANVNSLDTTWLKADLSQFNLPLRYAVLFPGGSAHRTEKMLPYRQWAHLCEYLIKKNITPVLIGTQLEIEVVFNIIQYASKELNVNNSDILNIVGKTNIEQVSELARGAMLCISGDSGPAHIMGATNCDIIVLFDEKTNYNQSKPIGKKVHIIQDGRLRDLSCDIVIEKIDQIITK